jgi:hypothetical protein
MTPETLVVSRGMALHKMIRFITIALGGEVRKYLTITTLNTLLSIIHCVNPFERLLLLTTLNCLGVFDIHG